MIATSFDVGSPATLETGVTATSGVNGTFAQSVGMKVLSAWLGGPGAEHRPESGSDTEAYDEGVVSVTPLVLDLWGRSEEARVRSLVASLGGT